MSSAAACDAVQMPIHGPVPGLPSRLVSNDGNQRLGLASSRWSRRFKSLLVACVGPLYAQRSIVVVR